MKILILSNCPVVESQGSGYIIINTAKALENSGHKVTIVEPSEFILFSNLNSARIYRIAMGMAIWVLRNRKQVKDVDRLIFYGAECFLALYTLKSVMFLNIPVILHSNGLEIHVEKKLAEYVDLLNEKKKWYHFNLNIFFRYTYRKVDTIITLSDYDRNFGIENLKIDQSKIFTLEPCLPEIFFKKNKIDQKKADIITFCGSWINRKGIQAIKESIPFILVENPKYTFRIIGVGNEFNVNDHFSENILERIEVFPLIKEKEKLIELYSESQIFLFPSLCESFGLVVAEAMFCRCCVITGSTGLAANIKNGVEGIVLNQPNSSNIVKALTQLINSTNLREDMGNAAKNRVINLQWADYQKRLETIILNNV